MKPIEVTLSPDLKSYGYHDSAGHWIKVDNRYIAACKVGYGLVLAGMLVAFERAGPSRSAPLIADLVRDVGTIRLVGTKTPVLVWFARRLSRTVSGAPSRMGPRRSARMERKS